MIVSADNNFGLKLFKELNSADPDINLFISPLSVSMALGMTLNGANVDTYEAMKNTLELNGLTETIDFRVDKPYMFMIREKLSGTTLFIGKVLEL